MKLFVFALLTIVGLVGGVVVGSSFRVAGGYDFLAGRAMPSSANPTAMIFCAIAGTAAGMAAAAVGFALTGGDKKD